MNLLLTSAGITNNTLRNELVDLLDQPIEESKVILLATAIYGEDEGDSFLWLEMEQIHSLGWQRFGVLEMSTFDTLPQGKWMPQLQEADCIILGGGNGWYLSYWLVKTGLISVLPELARQGAVLMGISAGSAMLTKELQIDEVFLAQTGLYHDPDFGETSFSGAGAAQTMQLVNIMFRPHLNSPNWPQARLENFEETAMRYNVPTYAIDDSSAIKVKDDKLVGFVGEGNNKIIIPTSKLRLNLP